MKAAVIALSACLLAACAGKVEYIRPVSNIELQNTKIIDKPRSQVWDFAVPELGKRFFTINNLDKSSGLINVSYSGDPERYIDCGTITSYVQNARGERTYSFAGQKADQRYEVLRPNSGLFFIHRRMSLEGRVNLIFEEIGPSKTRVTANTRYVITRHQDIRTVDGRGNTVTDTAATNTGTVAQIGGGEQSLECMPTGRLEQEILAAVQ